MLLHCRDKTIDLSTPVVMGVLNVTPDSFSDGGRFTSLDDAVKHTLEMERAGAAIIDIGGESTRPGAGAVTVGEELDRVLPVIRQLAPRLTAPISIDTSKPEVMSQAVAAGATMINDVRALREPGALEAARSLDVPVCLMHMQGEPRTMQSAPHYDDVVADVKRFLAGRIDACAAAGLSKDNLVVDPGFGFGKTLEQNLRLFAALGEFCDLGTPILVGVSRKSMIGAIIDKPVENRLYAGVALAALAAWQGAGIIRTHDVGPTADALRSCHAVRSQSSEGGRL